MQQNIRDTVLTLSGVAALVIGTYFPLFQKNPRYDGDIPTGYVHELSAGIHHIFDVTLLGLAGIVIAALVFDQLRFPRAVVSLLVGLLAMGFASRYLLLPAYRSFTWYFDATAPFVPELGWYGMIIGGSLLLIAGGRLVDFTKHIGTSDILQS